MTRRYGSGGGDGPPTELTGCGFEPSHVSARNPDDEPLVGDSGEIHVRSGDEFDYVLARPDGDEFGFDAVEIPEIRELLEHTQGDG